MGEKFLINILVYITKIQLFFNILNQIFNYLCQSYMHYNHFITIKLDITYFKSKNYNFTFILIIIIIIDFLQFIYF